MAILYGTPSNGETLPVLVDQYGNLLAKGIKGDPGGPGVPGPPGGDFPLPPDPYEGALLGWLNNELAWIGVPPVPIPPGVFGPIVDWESAGRLTVEGLIPEQIGQGVFIYQCNQDGTIFVNGWNNSETWSSTITGNFDNRGYEPQKAFNADVVNSQGWLPYGSPASVWTPETTITDIFSFRIKGVRVDNPGNTIKVTLANDSVVDVSSQVGESDEWHAITGVSSIKSVEITGVNFSNTYCLLKGFEINGALLVDKGEYPSAPNLNFRVQSVSGQNLIGSANRTDNFTIGKYLRVPQQNVARWLYDGNLSKVITSMGIDISRLNEN